MRLATFVVLLVLPVAVRAAEPATISQADVDAATASAIRTVIGLANQIVQDQTTIGQCRTQVADLTSKLATKGSSP